MIGAGTIGLLATQLLIARGGLVDVLVVEPNRVGLVERIGASPVREIETAAYPLVVEAAGVPSSARDAVRAIAPGGMVALTGVQSSPVDGFDLNGLVLKDASATGVLNGPGLFDAALAEIAAGSIDAGILIDSEFSLDLADSALSLLSDGSRPAPKIMLRID